MINLDWTLLAAGFVFLLTLWAVNRLLFRPLFAVLDERRSRTVGTQGSAAEQMRYREALFQEYSDKIKTEKQRGYQKAEQIRRDTMELRREKVAEARDAAELILKDARDTVEREMVSVRGQIRKDAEEIARLISARVLNKS